MCVSHHIAIAESNLRIIKAVDLFENDDALLLVSERRGIVAQVVIHHSQRRIGRGCVCVFVCVCERGKTRERERERER